MALHSTRWLALGYFTYFFSYGIFLPFWSVWLEGLGLTPENHRFTAGRGADCPFSRQFADCAARKRSLSSDLRFTYSGAVDAGVCAGLLGGHQRGVADGGDGRL